MSHPSRQKREARIEKSEALKEAVSGILSEHNKNKKGKPSRKKSPEEIAKLFNKDDIDLSKYIRDPNNWVSKSYNLDKQKVDFIRWVYCLYPVPQFMFIFFTERKPGSSSPSNTLRQLIFFEWFIAMAQGGSFAKCSREIFTKKEAHLFLNAPDNNTIEENIWWAKGTSINLDHKVLHVIVKRLFHNLGTTNLFFKLDTDNLFWWQRLLVLLKNCEDEVSIESLNDIMDFLRYERYHDENFDLKGRTFNSLIKLSNEWHRTMQLKKFGNQNLSWVGLDIPDWTWTDKKMKSVWTVKQLLTSKELYNDGKRMRHCVASYGHRCLQGNSAIFSVMEDDGVNQPQKFITVEINSGRELIHASARMNRLPTGRSKLVMNKWLTHNNIRKGRY